MKQQIPETKEPIKYVPGAVVKSPCAGEPMMVLKERSTVYPTKGKWCLTRWRVAFIEKGKETADDNYYRAIEEIGVENTNISKPIITSEYYNNSGEDNFDADISPDKKVVKKKVKRSKNGEMTELKARSIINCYKKKNFDKATDIDKAIKFLLESDQGKYLKKKFPEYQKILDNI